MTIPFDREEIALLSQRGLTVRHIAERLGCAERTVSRARAELGIKQGSTPQPVTAERLAAAERMLADGMPLSEIRKELHLGNSSIERYLPGRGWSKAQAGQYGQMVRALNNIEPVGSERRTA